MGFQGSTMWSKHSYDVSWSLMKEINFFFNPPFFISMASAAKFVLPIPIFLAYLVPLDVDVTGNITAKICEVWSEFKIFCTLVTRVREMCQSCQTWPAKFGQILLRTDTRLVFCNRKLMRTDIFFTRTTKPICNFANSGLPWQQPPFWIFSTPKSCHTLQWIFLQSFMKFDERNPIFFLNPPFFVSMATAASLSNWFWFFWLISFH